MQLGCDCSLCNLRGHGSAVLIYDVFMALGIVLTNSEYTDEMAHYNLSVDCLSNFP